MNIITVTPQPVCGCGRVINSWTRVCVICRRAGRVVPMTSTHDGSRQPVPGATWRVCTVCGRSKAPATFPKDPGGRDGRGTVCLGCGGAALARVARGATVTPRRTRAEAKPTGAASPMTRVCGGCRQRIVIVPAGASPCGCAALFQPTRRQGVSR
jgi:hypothetical protein